MHVVKKLLQDSWPSRKVKILDYGNFNSERFLADLYQVDWNNICGDRDVNQSFSRSSKALNRVLNKHARLKSLSERKVKLLARPWLTPSIRRSIRVTNHLFFKSEWQVI